MQIVFRPLAEADISDIWDYTEERWGLGKAREYFAELDRIFQSIMSFQEMARQRTEFDFEYINGFYNLRCRHLALGWKSPVACERKVA